MNRTVEFKITVLEGRGFPEIAEPPLEHQSDSKKKLKKKDGGLDWRRAMRFRFGRLAADTEEKLAVIEYDMSKHHLVERWEDIKLTHIFRKRIDEDFVNEIMTDKKLLTLEIFKARDENNISDCIGSASLDLLPLVHNCKVQQLKQWVPVTIASVSESRPITATKNDEPMRQVQGQPELHVQVSINESLLSQEDQNNGNRLTVSFGHMYNLPTTWEPREGQSTIDHIFEYIIGVEIPLNANLSKLYEIRGGRMYIKSDDDDDDDDENYSSKYIIVWESASLSFFLGKSAMERLEQMACKEEPLVVRVRRVIREEYNSEGWVDENEHHYRAEVRVAMEKLMYPGAQNMRESILLLPHRENNTEKATLQEAGNKKPTSAKKSKRNIPPELAVLEPDYAEGEHPYEKSATRLAVTLTLSTPIIPLLKDRPRPSIKLSDIIPKRKTIEKKVSSVELYRREIAQIVNMLAAEYVRMNQDGVMNREKFIFELNSRGIYFAFKEKIKQTVRSIVLEKFANVHGATRRDVDKFHNDLYVFLVKQMNTVINKLFNEATSNSRIAQRDAILGLDGSPTDRWKRLADEAEFARDTSLAQRYHQQRLASSSKNHMIWYEYGLFNMRIHEWDKAEKAFKEAISIDMSHLESLQVYGALLCMKQQYKEAEVFLQSSIDLDGNNCLSWGLLRLYFELVEKEKEARQADQYAKRALNSIQMGGEASDAIDVPSESAGIIVTKFLLKLHLHTLAEKVLLEEVRLNDSSIETHLQFADMYTIREDYQRAESHCRSAIKINHRSVEAWTKLGDIMNIVRRTAAAEEAYETAISVAKEETVPSVALYLTLGNLYLKGSKFEDAKTMFLLAAKYWPSATAWLGVGMAYYALDDLGHSEQALNEANIQNNLNPDVWGHLCMICIRTRRYEEAERSLREALRLKISNREIIAAIARLYRENDMPQEAEDMRKVLSV